VLGYDRSDRAPLAFQAGKYAVVAHKPAPLQAAA
jgi:hypothetical protein